MYRSTPEAEVRIKELDEKLTVVGEEMRAMEREVFAARRTLRRRKAWNATATGGLGALAGNVLGTIAWVNLGAPALVLAGGVVGFIFGFAPSYFRDDPDDDFPAAPPPRYPGGP